MDENMVWLIALFIRNTYEVQSTKYMPHGASLLRVERLIMHSMSSVYAYDVVWSTI